MSGESEFLDKLAESIADGASIDWKEIDKLPADHDVRRLAELYRLLAGVAEVHRSGVDDVSRPSDQISTKPATDHVSIDAAGTHIAGQLGQWGHLVLLRKIGEGAFGEVYQAQDTWLDHPVALKLFKRKTASRSSTHILHEARKLARVRHPNVVTVHGADSHDGQVGFWMDFVDGVTLADLVESGRLSAGEATYIGQEVCRALAAVHQADIVHRDVKAQNVMRASDGGRIILMDFGAGEFLGDQGPNLRAQGTPLYIAPELFSGQPATVRSDIYALGILLYYLVTGSFPVKGVSLADLIDAHHRGERRRLRDRRPDLPPSFVSIVERAIDSDPLRRFRSAGEMEAALGGAAVNDVRPIDIERLQGKENAHTVLQQIGLVALIALISLAAIEVYGFLASRVFEIAFGIESDFATSPISYFAIGIKALAPFAVLWTAGAAVLGVLSGLRPLFRVPLAVLHKKFAGTAKYVDADTLATLVFLSGAATWLAVCWKCWSVFEALDHLRDGPQLAPVNLSVLGSAGYALHRAHANYSAALSFFLGLAAWQWFPRLEKQAADPARVRRLKWAAVILALLVVAMAVVPRPFVFDRYEVVNYANEPAFVIGANSDSLLLYSPRNGQKRWRVRKDDAALQHGGSTGHIFDSQ